MAKQHTMEAIRTLCNGLSQSAIVDLMVEQYWHLDDSHKDEFLQRTDNP